MLKKMAAISYSQLLASLRGNQQAEAPPIVPAIEKEETTIEPVNLSETSTSTIDIVSAESEGAGQNEQVEESAPADTITVPLDAASDIASSRSQTPALRPITPPPQSPSSLKSSPPTPNNNNTNPPSNPSVVEERKELDEEQKYQAKVLILDLLGWGVSPDYMLQRGISHELICSVFTELRLRLPENIAADYAAIATLNTHA